ncbi:MAG: site-specific integrase [Acidobacteriaceae bacterium]
MATITKRGEFSHQVIIRRRGQPTITKTFSTRTNASAWARKVESELERGLWRDTSAADALLLKDALARYLIEVVPRLSGSGNKSIIKAFTDSPLARLSLSAIDSTQIEALQAAWLGAGLAASTVVRRLAVLSHLYTTARKSWKIGGIANPVADVNKPKIRDARKRRASDDELARICAVSESAELPAIVQLLKLTAMRRGEVVALRWEFVDLDAQFVHLPHTKNGTARDVPLSTAAVALLRSLPRDGERVFNVRADAVTKAWARARERAGIKDLRLHDIRHEATTRLSKKLSNVLELAAVTGHKDLKMLQRYFNPSASELAAKLG